MVSGVVIVAQIAEAAPENRTQRNQIVELGSEWSTLEGSAQLVNEAIS